MNRQASRYSTDRSIRILDSMGNRYEATLRDISKTGARMTSEARRNRIGDLILLDFGDGDIKHGVVRWASAYELGVRFTEVKEKQALAGIRYAKGKFPC